MTGSKVALGFRARTGWAGREFGSPWRKEQKEAALVAWMTVTAKLRPSS